MSGETFDIQVISRATTLERQNVHMVQFHRNVRLFIMEVHRNVGMFIMVVVTSTEGRTDGRAGLQMHTNIRVHTWYMRSKRRVQSSFISAHAQLREYRRRTRRADDDHCLLLGRLVQAIGYCCGFQPLITEDLYPRRCIIKINVFKQFIYETDSGYISITEPVFFYQLWPILQVPTTRKQVLIMM